MIKLDPDEELGLHYLNTIIGIFTGSDKIHKEGRSIKIVVMLIMKARIQTCTSTGYHSRKLTLETRDVLQI